eukprot:835718-Prorocentrum_minimum.AAC.3
MSNTLCTSKNLASSSWASSLMRRIMRPWRYLASSTPQSHDPPHQRRCPARGVAKGFDVQRVLLIGGWNPNTICVTGINWENVSTYEPKIMLTNSPA